MDARCWLLGWMGAAAAALAACCLPAMAQDWPNRPVMLIVPSPPGDGSDIAARLLAEKLRARLGQPFVVENRPGAGGVIASTYVARLPADGYAFIMGNAGSHGINPAIQDKIAYDAVQDFTPVSMIYRAPNIFVASTKWKANTLAEFVAEARARTDKLTYASGGIGSSGHMNSEYLKTLTGIDANHVPYRGAGPALNDLVSGQVDFMAVNLPPAVGLVRSGQIKALAVTTAKRSPALPDVPTVAESGFKDYETVAWFGIMGPKDLPAAIVQKLSAEIARACVEQDFQERLAALSGEVYCNGPGAFGRFIANDIARWKDVAARARVKVE
jgi:tripartite-type tricarboxylate transporter receptor subunit TctC